jgi:antitoxin ParD1/3/4
MKARVATMNVSLPAPLRARLDKKVQKLGSYGSTSEYVRELIRRDLHRDVLAHLDQLITEGASSPTERVTPEWWKERYAALARHRKERAKKQERKRA